MTNWIFVEFNYNVAVVAMKVDMKETIGDIDSAHERRRIWQNIVWNVFDPSDNFIQESGPLLF